jgi:hypothetical protein
MTNQPPDWLSDLDISTDSVRLIGNDTNVKCLIVYDLTPLTEEQRKVFAERALLALTRMADKVINRRNQN